MNVDMLPVVGVDGEEEVPNQRVHDEKRQEITFWRSAQHSRPGPPQKDSAARWPAPAKEGLPHAAAVPRGWGARRPALGVATWSEIGLRDLPTKTQVGAAAQGRLLPFDQRGPVVRLARPGGDPASKSAVQCSARGRAAWVGYPCIPEGTAMHGYGPVDNVQVADALVVEVFRTC